MSNELLAALAQAVIDGEPEDVRRRTILALEAGLDPLQIVEQGLVRGITVVGDKFGCGELWLPELLRGAEAMEAGMREVEEPLLARGGQRQGLGTVVLGTVKIGRAHV